MNNNIQTFNFRVLAEVAGSSVPVVVSRSKKEGNAKKSMRNYYNAIVQSVYDNSVVAARYQGVNVNF